MPVFNNIIAGASGQAGGAAAGYEIERSLRFDSSSSAFLSRTPSTAGNRKTWTWAGWVKRSKLTINQWIFSAASGPTADRNNFLFNTDDKLVVGFNISGTWTNSITDAVFRDASAWYHIVVALDTTQSTDSNRTKIYVNGVQQTLTGTYPAQNADTPINDTVAHSLGRYEAGSSDYFNGYLADVHFIDGQALAPTDFGEFDATTGVWNPIVYTGSYGTNGFHLPFSDNSSASALGTDDSGNGNNWTVNNISVAAGAGNDSLRDSPTNGDPADDTGLGGQLQGNYCTWNPLNTSTYTFANGNLEGTGYAPTNQMTSTIGVSSGKWYAEFVVSGSGSASNTMIGISQGEQGYYPGQLSTSYGYIAGTGQLYNNGSPSSYGSTYTYGDVIGVALDMDAGTLTIYKNNTSQGQAASGLTGSYFFAARNSSTASDKLIANWGQRSFAYSAPSGFKALCTANLDDPTIADGSAYMDATLYTGNGSTKTISGLGFSPDFVWIKRRNSSSDHQLYDIVRGTNNGLSTNLTDAEWNYGNGLTSFNSDGFTLGDLGGANRLNDTHVAWTWDGGSSTVSNTDGSITSQVRASASSGFSIVTYTTDTSSANQTIGHGLGAQPKLIIIKARNQAYNWDIYHAGISNAKDGRLIFTTAAFSTANAPFGTVDPTSSVFTMYQTSYGNNVDCVAYCFAPVEGYSAFGSYTGNGSADGPFVYTGHRSRWIMWKQSSASGQPWIIYDTERDPYNRAGHVLSANNSNSEFDDTGYNYYGMDINSNGFKIRATDVGINASGATYIWASFAENPFKYARAR